MLYDRFGLSLLICYFQKFTIKLHTDAGVAKIAVLKFCLIRVLKIYEIYTKYIRNIYEIYTNIYKIYTKYQAAARRRLPGQAPRRGPGPARAPRGLAGQPPPGRRLVFCIYLVYICIYLVYICIFLYIFVYNFVPSVLPVPNRHKGDAINVPDPYIRLSLIN